MFWAYGRAVGCWGFRVYGFTVQGGPLFVKLPYLGQWSFGSSREIVGAAVGETPVDEEPLLMLLSGSMGSLNPKPKP